MEKRNRSEEYATLYVDKVQNAIHSGMYIHVGLALGLELGLRA